MAARPSLHDLRILGEGLVVIVLTWLALGWVPGDAISQIDGSQLVMPYLRGSLAAGPDWTHYLYRVGVLGGSEMHAFGGTMPLVQMGAALGLSTTTTVNAITWFVQLALAYFSIVSIESLGALWSGAPARLGAAARIVAVWLCAFSPVVGWRLGVGHDNLLLGLLPFVATFALMLAASAGRVTATALVVAAFAVANGVSGLGAQTVVYGVIFGAPLAVVAIVLAPRGMRWSRPRGQAIAALTAGALLVLPRVAPMASHALGDDATRSLGASVVYSWSTSAWTDWLASIPWTAAAATDAHVGGTAHEFNFPLGPLAIMLFALWPRGASKKLIVTAGVVVVLVILLADHVSPLSDAILAAVPPLRAFRVPSRAILPVAVLLPALAVAAWTAATAAPTDTRLARASAVGILIAGALIVLGHALPAWPREAVAWLGCGALAWCALRRPAAFRARALVAALAPIAALGVLAFDERIPHQLPLDTIEHGPQRVRAAVLAQVPEAASPLVRVQLPHTQPPFLVSTAWAADLGTTDGVFYPPRRFVQLVSALVHEDLPPTTCNFDLGHDPQLLAIQQLYDVVAQGFLHRDHGEITLLPKPVGAAWFPAELVRAPDAAAIAAAMAPAATLHDTLARTAWLLASDPAPSPIDAADPACARAVVHAATPDADGQAITLTVEAPATCVLVVSTNYTSLLHATANPAGGVATDAAVFPIDIALTGVAVPAGTSTVVLAPRLDVPTWTSVLALVGALLLAAAIVDAARRR